MIKLIKNEWNKLKFPVITTLLLSTIISIILTCTLYKSYSLFYDFEAWEIGTNILDFIFPLLVVLPICWLMYYERKNSFLLYTMPRITPAKYILAKWITAAVLAFAIIFIPYFLSAVASLTIKPAISP